MNEFDEESESDEPGRSVGSPLDHIKDRELDLLILKMGSFLSIIENKKANQAKLLINILTNPKFRTLCLEIADIDNLQVLIKSIVYKYPTLCKSKVVYNALKNDRTNIHRKKSV